MLMNVEMPTIVGIETFMSRIIACSVQLSRENILLFPPKIKMNRYRESSTSTYQFRLNCAREE